MDVSKHLEKAAEAVRKKSYDYAIDLYHQVLKLKPDHGEARRALREALDKRFEYKKVPAFLALVQGMPSRLSIALGSLSRNHAQVAQAAEAYLKNDPKNRGVNRALAEALEKAGHLRSAVAVWEHLGSDAAAGDEALKRAGNLYFQLKEMQKALGCFEVVLKRSPRDSEAEKMRKNLAAEGVLSSGSYDPTRSSRDLARDKDAARHHEVEQKLVTTDDEKELLKKAAHGKVAANPADKRARRDLVELHVKSRDYAAAARVLEEGIALDPESFDLRDRLGDVRILGFEQQVRDLRAAADRGDAAAATDLADLEREKRDFEIEEFTRRAKAHPTDLDLRYRLGRLLLAAGNVDAAIENFQHAVKDPRRRIEALIGLGSAFQHKQLPDLAQKQFEAALEGVDAQSERATEIHYALGVLAEGAGDRDAAKRRFETIYERNIHFRDVGERLERLRRAPAPAREEIVPRAPAGEPADRAGARDPERPGGPAGPIYDFKD